MGTLEDPKYTQPRTREYEKPTIIRENKMAFPSDILNSKDTGYVCRQCSSCHGCR